MHTLLIVVGVIVAVPILLILLVILYRLGMVFIVLKAFRGALSDIGNKALSAQPEEIHLAPAPGKVWKDPEAMKKLEDPLAARGFAPAGDYVIGEFPGLYARFLLNAEARAYACLYEHPKAGVWLDVISRFEDGTGATFSTGPDRGMEHRPENILVHAPELSSDALFDRLVKERPNKPLTVLTAEGLVLLFEGAYREQAAWRKSRGASPQEVAKVIATRKPQSE